MPTSTGTALMTPLDHAVANENRAIGWGSLYRVAAIATALIVLLYLLDIAVTFSPAASGASSTLTIRDWLVLLQDHTFLALRNLGLLNVLSLALTVPLYLALYAAHRHVNPPYAALALLIGWIGITIYLANNPALPLLHLSRQYAAASTEAEQTLFLAAGQALLAQAEDFTPGSFIGFLVPTIGWMTMAGVMLRGGIFGRVTGWTMMSGSAFLLVFVICATFIPSLFNVVMIFAMLGGILNIVAYGLIVRRLWQLAQMEAENVSES